jgi:hypothetical protein
LTFSAFQEGSPATQWSNEDPVSVMKILFRR